jgi:ribosomal protein S9
MKKLLLAFVFVLVSQIGFAQENASKEDVSAVIEKSGNSGQMSAARTQMLTMIPQDKHAAFLVDFDILMKKVNDATVEIYMQEYSKEDIKAMLAFYNSPVGKKMAEKSEKIANKSQESMASLQGEIQALMMKYIP